MSEAQAAAARPPILFAPSLRLGRMAWRVLPWFGISVIVLLGAWILGADRPVLGQLAFGAVALVIYGILLALVTEIFSPDRSELRLVPVSDAKARRLSVTIRGLLFFLFATGLGALVIDRNGWHSGVADLLLLLRSVVILLGVGGLLGGSGLLARLRSASPEVWYGRLARFTGWWAYPIGMLALLFYVVASGLGYVPLANWVLANAGWTILKLFAASLAYGWLRRTLTRVVRFYRADQQAESADGEATRLELDTVGLGIERIGAGLLRAAAIVATTLWVLNGWNLTPPVLAAWLGTPMVGDGGTTWGHFLGGILKVALVFFAGSLLKNVLLYFVFPRTRMGVGARYAVLAVLRYVVIALTIVFGLAALGVDTGSMGWFFGAAGIGIGLGLQDIIGNFISGLIMLVERPIRVGDTVTIGDATGKVENIHMRGTTLRTFDNTTVLIPNNQLLGERVTNLSYGMQTARVIVDIGVAYDSNPVQVEKILLDIARAHPGVVADPEPKVMFQMFGASSLDFRLLSHTDQITSRFGIASELRFAIFQRFRQVGIEIPFPQQDLHLKGGWPTP